MMAMSYHGNRQISSTHTWNSVFPLGLMLSLRVKCVCAVSDLFVDYWVILALIVTENRRQKWQDIQACKGMR